MLIRLLLSVTLLALPSATLAEKTLDLFSTEALVVNQSPEILRQAASTGLATVLVRMSGTRSVLGNPEVSQAIENAFDYLYQFSYQSTDETILLPGAEQPATRLLMRFSQAPLEKLLQHNRLPLWSASRPDLLVWTAFDDQTDNRDKAYVNNESAMGDALATAAQNRGLPMSFPVLDLEDRSALSVSRLWAMDEDGIRRAAGRYQTDAVLAGRFRKDRKQWTGNFMLLHQDGSTWLNATGTDRTSIAANIVGQVTDYFVAIYGVNPVARTSDETVIVQVNNADDFAAYIQVLNYLEKLPLVNTSLLVKVAYPVMQIELNLNTDLEQFLDTLALDKKLKLLNADRQLPTGPQGVLVTEAEQDKPETLEFVWLNY